MELEPGFKLSEAGPIPEDWQPEKLGDHFEFKNGISKAGHFFGHGTPIVNFKDVFAQPRLLLHRLRGQVSVNVDEAKRFSVRRGDAFFTRTSETAEEIGMAAVALDDRPNVVFSGFVLRGRPCTARFEPEYLAYVLRTPVVRAQIEARATYTTRALTNGSTLSLINIPAPSADEQCAIAVALNDVDVWIVEAEAELAKLASVKAAAMDTLLTPTARLPGFTKEWERVRLGDLYDPLSTVAVARAAYVSGQAVACVHYGDIHVRYDGFVRIGQDHVATVPTRLVRAATKLKSGDVLVADAAEDLNGVGKAVELVAPEACEVVGGLHVQALRPKVNRIALGFSGYLFRQKAYREAVERSASGLKVFGISKSQLATVEIFLPPTLSEQQAIAAVLSDIDSALATARAVVAKARGVKAGTMDALLSGRVRLPSFDRAACRAPSDAQGAA